MSYVVTVKSVVEILQNFGAFSEYIYELQKQSYPETQKLPPLFSTLYSLPLQSQVYERCIAANKVKILWHKLVLISLSLEFFLKTLCKDQVTFYDILWAKTRTQPSRDCVQKWILSGCQWMFCYKSFVTIFCLDDELS